MAVLEGCPSQKKSSFLETALGGAGMFTVGRQSTWKPRVCGTDRWLDTCRRACARVLSLATQHSARLCALGPGGTEVDLLYGHAALLSGNKVGAGGRFVTRQRVLRRPPGPFRAQICNVAPPPPRVTFRRVVVSLRGPGQSPGLPFACCVGSMRSVGRCGRCSCWCRFRVHGAQYLVCRGCAGCGGMWQVARQWRPVVGVLGLCWLLLGVV